MTAKGELIDKDYHICGRIDAHGDCGGRHEHPDGLLVVQISEAALDQIALVGGESSVMKRDARFEGLPQVIQCRRILEPHHLSLVPIEIGFLQILQILADLTGGLLRIPAAGAIHQHSDSLTGEPGDQSPAEWILASWW